MGRVRLNSEYIADSESTIFMEGAKVPPPTAVEVDNLKPVALEEEVKDTNEFEGIDSDDEMSGSNCEVKTKDQKEIDYSSLPSIDQILETNGFGVKFG